MATAHGLTDPPARSPGHCHPPWDGSWWIPLTGWTCRQRELLDKMDSVAGAGASVLTILACLVPTPLEWMDATIGNWHAFSVGIVTEERRSVRSCVQPAAQLRCTLNKPGRLTCPVLLAEDLSTLQAVRSALTCHVETCPDKLFEFLHQSERIFPRSRSSMVRKKEKKRKEKHVEAGNTPTPALLK
jgi:hypothetical protein